MANDATHEAADNFLSVEEKEILSKLQKRLKGIGSYISKLDEELTSLEIDGTNNSTLINEECDLVIEIVENYRKSLLDYMEKLKEKKKNEIKRELNRMKRVETIAVETSNKCHQYAMNNNNKYRLVGINKIINDGYQQNLKIMLIIII